MKKQDEHNKLMDEAFAEYLTKNKQSDVSKPASKLVDASKPAVEVPTSGNEDNMDDERNTGMAQGGLVGELPIHADRYGWQRQNFKK
jgi:hypothetical protein